jgi:hypothetical protein
VASGIGGLLTQKIGPFPGYVWALGVGGVVFLLGPKLLKSSGTSSAGTAAAGPSGFDPQSFAAGFSQGAQYQPGSGSSPIPQPDTLAAQPVAQTPIGFNSTGLSASQAPAPVISSFPIRRLISPSPVGGAARNRSASVGSISADPHAYFHPAVKRVPKFPHFVRGGVGGAEGGAPLAHAAAVHQLAHQAEVHPARLQLLNPRPHRFIRVA